MLSSPDDPIPKRRTWRRWPPEAFEIVKQKKTPAALCRELESVSGNDTRACWRFLNKHGIRRPGSATRHKYDRDVCEKLIEFISDNGVHAAAHRFGYDTKSLYNLLYRQEYTRMSKDTLTLRQLSMHLRMRFSQVRGWVEQGLLKAKRHQFKSGRVSYLVEIDEIRKFCKEHKDLIITRRFSPKRLHFLEECVFAPKHADLIPSRAAKREAEAFERKEYLENTRYSQRSA